MGQAVPPKLNPARRNVRTGPLKLPKEGRKGAPPRWPLAIPPDEAERKAWRDMWKLPQAVAWEHMRSERAVARYCRMACKAEVPGAKPQYLSEVRQMEDKLGLTPKAMRMLLWEIVDDEVADKRQDSQVASVRSRIKAVG